MCSSGIVSNQELTSLLVLSHMKLSPRQFDNDIIKIKQTQRMKSWNSHLSFTHEVTITQTKRLYNNRFKYL